MKTLVSPALAYAYLSAAYDAGASVRNPLHTLKPLILSVFEKNSGRALNRDQVAEVFASMFGIDVPLNIFSYVMASMVNVDGTLIRRSDQGIKDIAHANYIPADLIRVKETKQLERDAKRRWNVAVNQIRAQLVYAKRDFGRPEDVLEQFLDTSSIGFVGHGGKAYAQTGSDRDLNQFIFHCIESDNEGEFLEALTELAIGDVLYQSIKSVTEFEAGYDEAINRSMEGVSVFFDTRFVLNLLGVNGPEFERSARETLALCQQTSCKTKVFEHTVDEIDDIFITVSGKMQSGSAADGGVASFALEQAMSPSDLLDFAARISEKVSGFGIAIEKTSDISKDLSVNERELHDRLEIDLRQKNVDARTRDIASLTGVFREREGKPHKYLEDCKAIFVTTNKGLADSATSFFRQHFRDEGLHNTVQVCMTDVVFSTRLWIKLPTSSKKLPKEQVLAHILTNLRPNENLRANFLRKLRSMVSEGKFSDIKYSVVSLSRFTDRMLAADYDLSQTDIENDQAVTAANRVVEEFKKIIDKAKKTSNPEDLERIKELERELSEIATASPDADVGSAQSEFADMKSDLERAQAEKRGAERAIERVSKWLAYGITALLLWPIVGLVLGYWNEDSQTLSLLNLFLAVLTAYGLSFTGLVQWIASRIIRSASSGSG